MGCYAHCSRKNRNHFFTSDNLLHIYALIHECGSYCKKVIHGYSCTLEEVVTLPCLIYSFVMCHSPKLGQKYCTVRQVCLIRINQFIQSLQEHDEHRVSSILVDDPNDSMVVRVNAQGFHPKNVAIHKVIYSVRYCSFILDFM